MTGMDIVNKAKSYQGKYAKHNNKFTKYFKGKYNVQKNGYYKNGYCTLFVMYVYAQLGILSWMPKKTDHTQKMYSYLKKHGKIIKDPKKAKAGMPAFKKCGSTSKKSSGHTAIFWKYEGGYVYTVDGNCSGGVVVRKKKPEWYLGFGNIVKESAPAQKPTPKPTPKAFALKNKPIAYDRISQAFNSKSHKGIDLVDNRGTDAKVYAVADGVVVAASFGAWDKSYGNMCAIDHGNNTYTNYAHLSKITVKKGQRVNAGNVIGYQGSTGNSTGNHLHFEIHLNGKWNRVNPKPYLDALNRPSYVVGKEYTLVREDMNVRQDCGTKYAKVGVKKKGTKVVVKATKKVSGTTCWVKIGDKQWICGYSGGKVYIK